MGDVTVLVQQVPGTRWLVVGDLSTNRLAFDYIRPEHPSHELLDAIEGKLRATASGVCAGCGAVAGTPAWIKTAPARETKYTSESGVDHDPACAYSPQRITQLEKRDCLGREVPEVDESPESVDPLVDFLRYLTGDDQRAAEQVDRFLNDLLPPPDTTETP